MVKEKLSIKNSLYFFLVFALLCQVSGLKKHAKGFDWVTELCVSFVTGQGEYFGYGFTTLD